MRELSRLSVCGIIFLVGAIIYLINLVLSLARRPLIPIDAVGIMVFGLGLALLFRC